MEHPCKETRDEKLTINVIREKVVLETKWDAVLPLGHLSSNDSYAVHGDNSLMLYSMRHRLKTFNLEGLYHKSK